MSIESYLSGLEVACLEHDRDPTFVSATSSLPVSCVDLTSERIHCWRFTTDPNRFWSSSVEHTLSREERERARSFKLPGLSERFVQTRLALRYVLSGYVNCAPSDLVMMQHAHGKPFILAADGSMPIRFNLSHSADEFLLGVALDRELGVDVEVLTRRTDPEGIARRYFHPAEQAFMDAAGPDPDRLVAFFRCWTIKEAYVKAIGQGLRFPLSAFDVSPVMQQPKGCPLEVDDRIWHCVSWQPTPDSMAAVMVEQR